MRLGDVDDMVMSMGVPGETDISVTVVGSAVHAGCAATAII
jgi:hypothetical protein